jgi:hypothetical protein
LLIDFANLYLNSIIIQAPPRMTVNQVALVLTPPAAM